MIIKNEIKTKDIKGLIFDIDGTLTRFTSVSSFLKDVLTYFNLSYDDGVVKEFYKAVSYYECIILTKGIANIKDYAYVLKNTIQILKNSNISGEDFCSVMFQKEADYTYTCSNIKHELEELSKDYLLYCYTNWFKNQAIKKLEKHMLNDYFIDLFCFENNFIKFSKVGFSYIVAKTGINSEQFIHIGDSSSDLICNKASINSILIDYENKNQELYDNANCVLTEFEDIRKILRR